jgi:hypothetical protein
MTTGFAVACAAWFREYTNRKIEARNHKQGGYRLSPRDPHAASIALF